MTKLTFDVDFSKAPEDILREIQEKAKAEVARRESKEKSTAYLSQLHLKVNEDIDSDFKSINELIKALTPFANQKFREKLSRSSASGRRVTVSMTEELLAKIKSSLSLPQPNKAAIAREYGVSVVQVRKVASGGYDNKFSSDQSRADSEKPSLSTTESSAMDPLPKVAPEPTSEEPPAPIAPPSLEKEEALPPAPSPELPPVPAAEESLSPVEPEAQEEPSAPLPPPSFGEEEATLPPPIALPPAPSPELPPVPAAEESLSPVEPEAQEEPSAPLPPPSFGEEEATLPPPIALPPAPSPELPPVPAAEESLSPVEPEAQEEPSAPPPFPSPNAPAASPLPPSPPSKPGLSLKPKSASPGIGGKPGKPVLSLKSGKKKPSGLKITRPPMRPPSA